MPIKKGPKKVGRNCNIEEMIKAKKEAMYLLKKRKDKEMNEKLADQLLFLPKMVQLDEDLNSTARLLLIIVSAFDIGEHGCYASNLRLAKMVGCKISTVSNLIGFLKKKGYIIRNEQCILYGGRLFSRYVRSDLKRNSKEVSK